MQVKVGPSFRWFFILLFGGLLGAAVLYLLVVYEEGQPGHPLGVYLMVLGVALVPAALIPALRVRAFLQSGAQAKGTVIGVEERTETRNNSNVTYYHPRVQFTTPDGRMVVFTSSSGSEVEPDVGSPLNIRYRSDNPSLAELDSTAIWIQPALVGIVFGLALIVAGVVVYLGGVPVALEECRKQRHSTGSDHSLKGSNSRSRADRSRLTGRCRA